MVSTIYFNGSWFTVYGAGYRMAGAIRSVAGTPVPDFTRLPYLPGLSETSARPWVQRCRA